MEADEIKFDQLDLLIFKIKSEHSENIIGQSLISIGLYTLALECTALSFRTKAREYVLTNKNCDSKKILKSFETANGVFNVFGEILAQKSILSNDDLSFLHSLRKKRNEIAHKGFNYVLNLRINSVIPEIKRVYEIVQKVESYRFEDNPSKSIKLTISPLFFGFVLQLASQLSCDRLSMKEFDNIEDGFG